MKSRVFRELAAPKAPRELRARVLGACRLVAPGSRHWIDRLWESSALRLSWAATMLTLLIASAAVERSAPQPASPPVSTPGARSVELGLGDLGLLGFTRFEDTEELIHTHLFAPAEVSEFEL